MPSLLGKPGELTTANKTLTDLKPYIAQKTTEAAAEATSRNFIRAGQILDEALAYTEQRVASALLAKGKSKHNTRDPGNPGFAEFAGLNGEVTALTATMTTNKAAYAAAETARLAAVAAAATAAQTPAVLPAPTHLNVEAAATPPATPATPLASEATTSVHAAATHVAEEAVTQAAAHEAARQTAHLATEAAAAHLAAEVAAHLVAETEAREASEAAARLATETAERLATETAERLATETATATATRLAAEAETARLAAAALGTAQPTPPPTEEQVYQTALERLKQLELKAHQDLKKPLNAVILQIESLKAKGESLTDLNDALNKTYDRINQPDNASFEIIYNDTTKTMEGKPNAEMKELGTFMVVLGLAVAALALLLLGTIASAVTGTAILIPGAILAATGYGFFAKGSQQTGLSLMMSNLDKAEREIIEKPSHTASPAAG